MITNKRNFGKFIFAQCLLFILVAAGISACNLIPTKEKGDTQVAAEPLPDTAKNVAKSPGQIWLHNIESIKNIELQKRYGQKIYKSHTVKFGEPVLAENDVVKGEYYENVVYESGEGYSLKFIYKTVSETEVKYTSVIYTDHKGEQSDNTRGCFDDHGKPIHTILDLLDDGNMLVIASAYNIFVKK